MLQIINKREIRSLVGDDSARKFLKSTLRTLVAEIKIIFHRDALIAEVGLCVNEREASPAAERTMGKFMIFMNFHYSNFDDADMSTPAGKKGVRDEFVTAHCQLVFCVLLSPLFAFGGPSSVESGNIMKLTINSALKTSPNNRRTNERGVSLSWKEGARREPEKGFKMTTIKFYEFRFVCRLLLSMNSFCLLREAICRQHLATLARRREVREARRRIAINKTKKFSRSTDHIGRLSARIRHVNGREC